MGNFRLSNTNIITRLIWNKTKLLNYFTNVYILISNYRFVSTQWFSDLALLSPVVHLELFTIKWNNHCERNTGIKAHSLYLKLLSQDVFQFLYGFLPRVYFYFSRLNVIYRNVMLLLYSLHTGQVYQRAHMWISLLWVILFKWEYILFLGSQWNTITAVLFKWYPAKWPYQTFIDI